MPEDDPKDPQPEPNPDPQPGPEPEPTPAPEPSPEPKPGFDFREHLPDELKEEKLFEQVKDFSTLAKNYVESQKVITGMVKVPKADDPPEAWQKFYGKLGVPETSEGYELQKPDMPDHAEFNEQDFKPFLQTAHSLHLTPRQTQGVVNFYGDMLHQHSKILRQKASESMESLKEEWGGATERKITLAHQTIKKLGSDEVLELLESSGVGNHVAVVKLFSDVGELLEEDGLIDGTPVTGLSKEDAQKELTEIKANPKYRTNEDPELVKRAKYLYEFLYN
jgi:hypothetical protein